MDIVAHTLWAGAGVALWQRRAAVPRRTAAWTIGLAALPDVLQMIPVLAWWGFTGGAFDAVKAFAIAVPGRAPDLPASVTQLAYTLHCLSHSAIVATLATWLVWRLRGALWLPLLGWWSHILIDVFTHSSDYFPSPVLFPLTMRGFDGIAWNTPWFMGLNYLALTAIGAWLLLSGVVRRRSPTHTLRDGPVTRPPGP